MSFAGSLESRERLRLFFGLPIPSGPAALLAGWATDELGGFEGVRLLPVEHLHVTLAFLGDRPGGELSALRRALHQACDGLSRPVLSPVRYRETERVAMVVFNDLEERAGLLQARLSERLERLGAYESEGRRWLAHVTVARLRKRPRATPAVAGLPSISPSEAALYHSILRPTGAQYDIVEAVSLGG